MFITVRKPEQPVWVLYSAAEHTTPKATREIAVQVPDDDDVVEPNLSDLADEAELKAQHALDKAIDAARAEPGQRAQALATTLELSLIHI